MALLLKFVVSGLRILIGMREVYVVSIIFTNCFISTAVAQERYPCKYPGCPKEIREISGINGNLFPLIVVLIFLIVITLTLIVLSAKGCFSCLEYNHRLYCSRDDTATATEPPTVSVISNNYNYGSTNRYFIRSQLVTGYESIARPSAPMEEPVTDLPPEYQAPPSYFDCVWIPDSGRII